MEVRQITAKFRIYTADFLYDATFDSFEDFIDHSKKDIKIWIEDVFDRYRGGFAKSESVEYIVNLLNGYYDFLKVMENPTTKEKHMVQEILSMYRFLDDSVDYTFCEIIEETTVKTTENKIVFGG